MKYVNSHGLDLSAMQLGTVQLGMEYGLGERVKPSEERAYAILDRAMELGINTLDTADNYGVSEQIIGRWLADRRREGKSLPWVITKISKLKHGSYDIVRDDILYKTEQCQKNLGVETIDCLMIHSFEDYADDRDNVHKVFDELKSQKAYAYSALSAYAHHDYGVIAQSGFDATQIPLNVFDWRQIDCGGMEKLAKSGMMVFTRSVFLQGLVFHTPETLDPRMSVCMEPLKRYIALYKEFELDPAAMALSFALSVPGVTAAVLGCDNVQQLESNCALVERTVALTQEQLDKIHNAFCNIDPRAITPGAWFDKK